MSNKPVLSVVIPVYKSGKHVLELYSRLKATLKSMNIPFELVFVEDCGGDSAWNQLQKVAETDKDVIIIQHTRNFGQHAATLCGINNSSGDWIVTIDDDLEHSPEDIPLLFSEVQKGYDLVYGIFEERSHSKWRNFTSNLARKVFNVIIPNMNYDYTGFRIMKQNIAKSLNRFDSSFPFIDGYLSWITNNYSTVHLQHGIRGSGESNYSLIKLVKHTFNIFIEFSNIPIKAGTWIGLCSSFVGFVWLIVVIGSRVLGNISQSGYPSIMAAILFFGGIQMFLIGIIGEYIAKINFKTSKKPLYIVSEFLKGGGK
ncbi:glycosyltransferase family 2 protein [Lysinibacillus sp. UGB7]|uniref:glycosyltransferase family 2 protein n=1 Tax=Lysinibacillus sp. UGB7 TaxID=3411039 RepID=UPI003B7F3629